MAGMLPGVECARRRRSGGWSDSPSAAAQGWTRRSSFCLYTSNHETTHLSSSSSLQRSTLYQAYQDAKLGGVAREAKDRLDERLRTRSKSETRRQSSRECHSRSAEGLHTEVFGLKKGTGSKRFDWARFSWKASDQDECAVCLDRFKPGETLVRLPCAHRFHSRCLVPWLETNGQCPCCRMEIFSQDVITH